MDIQSAPAAAQAAPQDAAPPATEPMDVDMQSNDVQGASTRDQTTEDASAEIKITPGAYRQREMYLQKLEDEGELAFKYVENNGQPHNMMYLISLKNIFSKQLPNMPKEYIARLVLDRRHRSVALVKRSGTVLGGITYRAFHEQGLGEIAFCAVTSSEQVKGFGTRLMNYTKEYAVTQDKLTHFLTYADNNAVGYFSKQGFTKEITMPKERWYGYIKDYDGGTLMECVMHPKLRPAQFPQMISAQRAALEARLRATSQAHVVRKGLSTFEKDPAKRTHVPIDRIPGVREAGWTQDKYGGLQNRFRVLLKEGKGGGGTAADATPKNLHKFMSNLWQEIYNDQDCWPFHVPVGKDVAPDYGDVIKDPIDMSLIQARLKSGPEGYYITLDIFVADLRRMFNNCGIYNSADSVYVKYANKLEGILDNYLTNYLIYD